MALVRCIAIGDSNLDQTQAQDACFDPVEGFSSVCGIAGYFGPPGAPAAALADQCRVMLDAIAYRGPDDSGVWTDERLPLVLGHCRLAVVELSEAGHQPMASRDQRFIIVFNGEIYNHVELRARLQQEGAVQTAAWRGHSDTETLLACIAAWGVQTALSSTVGMFAFALWDASTQELTLARDRMGEKPLYYGWQGASFLLGSELKALRGHSGFQAGCNSKAASAFLRFNYVPAPYSMYEGIHKLLPGTFLRMTLDDLSYRRTPHNRHRTGRCPSVPCTAKARLTRHFLRRKLAEFDQLQRTISELEAELGDRAP